MDFQKPAERLGLELDEYIELINLFLETCTADISGMEIAASSHDYKSLVERSHSLKGSSGNLGLTEIYEMAKEIETKARANGMEGFDNLIIRIKQHVSSITDALKGHN